MRALKKQIEARQSQQREHELFALLRVCGSVEAVATMARSLAWWPMVFQDVLRLNTARIQGSGFERFAEHHRDEDAGHDRWFVDDLRAFGVDDLSLEQLFADEFQAMRDACYALVSEVHRPQAPAQRVAFLLALEASGHVFFENVADATARLCPDLNLRYLSHWHLGVEKDHDLFTESTEADIDEIVLSATERQEAEGAIARVFATFDAIYDYLAENVTRTMRNVSYIRELVPGAASAPVLRVARGSR